MSDDQPIVATLDQLVKVYLKIRDARAERTREYEAEDRALKDAQDTIQATLLNTLNETGIESFKTKHGTVYRSEDILPQANDWDAFYEWVAEHKAFDALERRLKKTFISTFMEQNNGDAPPGVSVIRKYIVNVRRKN